MRTAGILLSVSSLPGNQGIGDFGKQAIYFIDALKTCGCHIWQILPLNPLGYGNSPYQPYSSFAGDEIYINIDRLADYDLIRRSSVKTFHKFSEQVDYEGVRIFKEPYFKKAYRIFKKQFDRFAEEYEQFCASSSWLDHYALFMTLKRKNHMAAWRMWDKNERELIKASTDAWEPYQEDMDYERFLQFMFYKQWNEIKAYANQHQIQIMGDIPFYVGLDSADVWSHQSEFLLTKDGRPTFIAGVPPDYFSETGQRWGNPIYNWRTMKRNNYTFWIERLRWNAQQYDIIRIDHFRAFDTYWKIPESCETAIEGKWILGPACSLLDEIFHQLPDIQIVAEDLGDLRKEVLELKDHYRLYGMQVLQFQFTAKQMKKGMPKHCILYTGTHDNDTMAAVYDRLPSNHKASLRRFFHMRGYTDRNIIDLVLRYCIDSAADIVIIPLQDILGLKKGRMNTPGTIGSPNWEWKMKNLKPLTIKAAQVCGWLMNAGRS